VVFGAGVSKWLALAALVALLWVARGVLPPFIIAGMLAYILSPLVDELAARSGVRRAWIALGVFVVVPFGPTHAITDMNIGILFMLGVSGRGGFVADGLLDRARAQGRLQA